MTRYGRQVALGFQNVCSLGHRTFPGRRRLSRTRGVSRPLERYIEDFGGFAHAAEQGAGIGALVGEGVLGTDQEVCTGSGSN